jgi:hypothetical protein
LKSYYEEEKHEEEIFSMQTIEDQYEVKNNNLEEFANQFRLNQNEIDKLKWHIAYDVDNDLVVHNVRDCFSF